MIELVLTLATIALVYALAHRHDKSTVKIRATRHDQRRR